MAQATFYQGEPTMIDYTPSGAAISAGEVKVVSNLPLVAHKDIADGYLGALAAFGGIYLMTGDAVISAGKRVWWKDSADKVSETADGNKHFGFTITACSADDATCYVLHMPEGHAQSTAVADLTDNTGGTADSTLVAISASYTQAEVRNNMADIAAKVNAILAVLRARGFLATT